MRRVDQPRRQGGSTTGHHIGTDMAEPTRICVLGSTTTHYQPHYRDRTTFNNLRGGQHQLLF